MINRYALLILVLIIFSSCQSAKEKRSNEIKAGESRLFNDSAKTFNTDEANKVFANYLAYADAYKDDTASASYLFKAGDLSNGLRRAKEAIQIFERLRKEYPDNKKAAVALFMEGFIYETGLQDKEMAKAKYKSFIEKYPDHKLFQSAQASLDQLNANLSDEELIKLFEKNNK